MMKPNIINDDTKSGLLNLRLETQLPTLNEQIWLSFVSWWDILWESCILPRRASSCPYKLVWLNNEIYGVFFFTYLVYSLIFRSVKDRYRLSNGKWGNTEKEWLRSSRVNFIDECEWRIIEGMNSKI